MTREAQTREASTRRYVEVANDLRERIESGAYEIGSHLPTEAQLTRQFDVSRSTVRQALGTLEEAGFIARRQGSGTKVIAQHAPVRYVLSATSEDDILRYASETVFDVQSTTTPIPFADARRLQLGDPARWTRIRGLRREPHGGPIGLTTVFVPARLADVTERIGQQARVALFSQIAEHHGLTITRIEQEITATLLTDEEATALDATTGAPALAITRRYHCAEIGLFEAAENIHPAERFSYALRLEREPAARLLIASR